MSVLEQHKLLALEVFILGSHAFQMTRKFNRPALTAPTPRSDIQTSGHGSRFDPNPNVVSGTAYFQAFTTGGI